MKQKVVFIVFSKAPVLGQVKSRLIPAFGKKKATQIYLSLLSHVLNTLFQAKLGPIHLYCTPDTTDDFFKICQHKYDLSLHVQQGNDLGERMYHAYTHALQKFQYAFIVGGDCPSIDSTHLNLALKDLKKYQAVISPAEDGGYVMLGLKEVHKVLFNSISWGTNQVLYETQQRFKQLNWRWSQLGTQWDVDYPEDVLRFKNLKTDEQVI